jgi:pilus assembly protein CpaE
MKSADVFILTGEDETAVAVCSALESPEGLVTANLCKSMAELRTRLSKPAPDATRSVAIVDIDGDPAQILFDLGKLTSANPSAFFVIISREFNEKLVLQAMQAGARHFLRKSAIASDLKPVVAQWLREDAPASEQGDVISVFSCSGGCGATTAAVNLAVELRLAQAASTLLVDLDCHYGSVAHHLNVTSQYGIAHILNRKGTIDRNLIESVAARSASEVDVLLSPAAADADATLSMDYDNLLRAFDVCRECYRCVVVDAPRVSRRVLADLASISRVAIVVFQLTALDVARARTLVAALTEHGVATDRILPLANRAGGRGSVVKPADARQALGVTSLFCVRSDWRKAIGSLTRGEPLATAAGRSRLRRDFRRIADQVRARIENGHSEHGGL